MKTNKFAGEQLYLCLISIHGLIRATNLELGRDADTGGQTLYVVELAKALARHSKVARVDLLTRAVTGPGVDESYSAPREELGDGAAIIRIPAGPSEYLPKEALWDHLAIYVDNALAYLRQQEQQPHLLHSHYADGGYVGSRLAHLMGLPLIHTGHSLGRVKRRRLIAGGLSVDEVETQYNMERRIEAEELALSSAQRVITSTQQEIQEQYELYDYYQPDQMCVIPPGTDLTRFYPPDGSESTTDIVREIHRFLREPEKPIILALSRPDRRKNISALVTAYGTSPRLKDRANLVIVAGNRDEIEELDRGSREVLTELLMLVDNFDLYGRVALPKHHAPSDVPVIYRMAAASGGVFVNPALTEPFGLTLIEAAATGLPIVATEDGGPRDIIANCGNGLLVDPLDPPAIANAINHILSNSEIRQEMAENGLKGVASHYSWAAHAERYIDTISPIVDRTAPPLIRPPRSKRSMLYNDRAIFSDIDQNLLGDQESLQSMVEVIRANRKCVTFGIATGRRIDSALRVMRKHGIPEPDILISSAGSAIHYTPDLTEDKPWTYHIEEDWSRQVVKRVLTDVPGLVIQPREQQSRFKLSYYIDTKRAPPVDEINQLLLQANQTVSVNLAFGQFLDILPIRASKGLALRYVAARWGIPLEHILVAGGSGADEDMMRGNTLAVVVGNRHHEELSQLEDIDRIYFATKPYASGILEAIDHYDFFQACNVDDDSAEGLESAS